MTYRYELWGSDRELGNDDHWTGEEGIATAEEAKRRLEETCASPRFAVGWEFGYVDGPEGNVLRVRNPSFAPSVDRDDDSEFAMQQGMAHGVDAYNEARGEDPSSGPSYGMGGP